LSDLITSDNPFSKADEAALKDIVGFMIPSGSGRPAASDEHIFADILATAKPHAPSIHQVLALYRQINLESLSRTRHPAVAVLVSVTVQCYYRDERVMRAIDMEARPPHPRGYEVDESDWSLLQPVRERAPLYRDINTPARG